MTTLQAREPLRHEILHDGLKFGIWHYPGPAQKLLFVHATGFHSRCWDQVINRLPEFDCWAFDMRGHGTSARPAPPYQWRRFGEDTAALMQALDLNVIAGIGHSMGGHAVTLAAAKEPHRFQSLVLIDPIIIKEECYNEELSQEHPVTRRKNQWRSSQEMYERFKGRPPFGTWDDAVLHDYCRFGLLPDSENGGLVLACPPAVEGSIYNLGHSPSANIYKEVAQLEIPVAVMHPTIAPGKRTEDLLPPDLYKRFKNGIDVPMPENSHFIPMESPDAVATQIRRMVSQLGRPYDGQAKAST